MCGIVGIVNFDSYEQVARTRLERMRDALEHRGPDGAGLHLAGRVGLGHRRLSIIDLDHGRQPMLSADGTACITYNGEIYNYRELRAELAARGPAFTTRSDTEVVLRAYQAFGVDCVERLRGMFAFAIWDARRQRLLLARDRLGIKPLYFACTGSELLFASEIKAILAAGSFEAALNPRVLPEFLATGYVSGGETMFEGVRKLLPGRTLSWSPEEGFEQRRYWQLPAALDEAPLSLAAQAREVRRRLDEAVESHLVSDVPVGVFLSGGMDSSGIAALMARRLAEPVRSFAIGFAERGYSELDHARRVAEAIGAEHRDLTLSSTEFFTALPRLVWHEDEPIAFPSSVALYFVSRLAREHVKVVLTGEGADELFLGYNRYRVAAWNHRLGAGYWAAVPAPLRAGVARLIGRLPHAVRRYAEHSFLATGPDVRGACYENFAVFPAELRGALLRGTGAAADPYVEALRHYAAAPADLLERLSHADLQTYLVELLMKQDQMSMAASLESRVPFLDHRFVEYAAALPAHYKLRGLRTKAVLREALAGLLPEEILHRPKMGFPAPVGPWLRGAHRDVVDEFVLGPRAEARGLFKPAALRRLAAEHQSGAADHGHRLWLLANLEIWQRVFIDGESPAEVAAGDAWLPGLPVAA